MKKSSEANNSTLELETNQSTVSLKAARNKIKPNGGSTFFAEADAYFHRMEMAGKYNQYTADKPRVSHFKEFIGQVIAFQYITPYSTRTIQRLSESHPQIK